MVNVKVYVEGGGDGRELRAKCRAGFSTFFRKTELAGQMPRVISCGARQEAYDKFRTALTKATKDDFFVLLVDSEGPVVKDIPWLHLKNCDNWDKPPGATDDNAHLMVQCMEAWFMADKVALAEFFGTGFNEGGLPARPDVEGIPKDDINNGLRMATCQCKPKGEYHKGRHSFAILGQLNPEKVFEASPHAQRLVNTLLDKSSSG
ncbi:MAG: DUF4276 family protein [Nitrospira sp.]|nr:DUF4276 family protein [Nitrospira sp.]